MSKTMSKPMTKGQLAEHLANKFDLTKKVGSEILDEIANLATSQTKKIGQFILPGLGKLVKAQRKARMGRNPATGETIKIPAKTVVKFRVGKAAKDAITPPRK